MTSIFVCAFIYMSAVPMNARKWHWISVSCRLPEGSTGNETRLICKSCVQPNKSLFESLTSRLFSCCRLFPWPGSIDQQTTLVITV